MKRKGIVRSALLSSFMLMWFSSCVFFDKAASTNHKKEAPMNILYITHSSLNPDYLSVYGKESRLTPNLQKLMKSGYVFKNHFSTSRWPFTANASLITGAPAVEHRVFLNWFHLLYYYPELEARQDMIPVEIPTFAELAKLNGYRTKLWAGEPHPSFFSKEAGIHRGYDEVSNQSIGYSHQLSNVIEFITNDSQKPFFAHITLVRTHFPHYFVPLFPSPIDRDPTAMLPLTESEFKEGLSACEKRDQSMCPMPIEQLYDRSNPDGDFGINAFRLSHFLLNQNPNITYPEYEKVYQNAVAYEDFLLKELYNSLIETSLIDRTIIVITSDVGHILPGKNKGYPSHWELEFEHGYSLPQIEALRVPLIIITPSRENKIITSEKLTQHTDLKGIFKEIFESREHNLASIINSIPDRNFVEGLQFRPHSYFDYFRISPKMFQVYFRGKTFSFDRLDSSRVYLKAMDFEMPELVKKMRDISPLHHELYNKFRKTDYYRVRKYKK